MQKEGSYNGAMIQEIYVALMRNGKPEPVGVISFDAKARSGAFRYMPSYNGPPLDPVNLDYTKPFTPGETPGRVGPRAFAIDPRQNPQLMHRVFLDAMPGYWGMTVLKAEYPELREMCAAEQCAWLGTRTAGALHLFVKRSGMDNPINGIEALRKAREQSEEFQRTMTALGLAGIKNPAFASHGGAMPKVSYKDDEGRHWLAKFNRVSDPIDYGAIEFAAMRTASMLGINVPRARLIDSSTTGDKSILLSQRYDRDGDKRRHKVSFFSLIGERKAQTLGDGGDYAWIADKLKESVAAEDFDAQRAELFRRIVFNVGLNIADDHLQNHELLLDPDTGKWELSPAFDLLPFAFNGARKCSVFGYGRLTLEEADAEKWQAIAGKLGIPVAVAMAEVARIREGIQDEWPKILGSVKTNEATLRDGLRAMEIGCGKTAQQATKYDPSKPLEFTTDHSTPTRKSGGLSF